MSTRDAFIDILSGTMGGVAQVAVGHPLDTVRVRLQTSNRYAGMTECMMRTFREEGFRGLYRGATSPLLGGALHNANIFFTYGQSKRFVGLMSGQVPGERLSVCNTFWAGALAGLGVCIVETPVDLLKIKLQAQLVAASDGAGVAGRQFAGVFDAARYIVRRRGILGLYQGTTATAVRNVPNFGFYFAAFEATKRWLAPADPSAPTPGYVYLLSGAAAGIAFWGNPLYPLEVIKSRLQAEPSDLALRRYAGIVDCFRHIVREEGVAALYRGFAPSVARAILANAVILWAVSTSKDAFYSS
jgi:solute carrier family 25 (mitochondrial carnitine/acylcarnitine transporter), member 20/29